MMMRLVHLLCLILLISTGSAAAETLKLGPAAPAGAHSDVLVWTTYGGESLDWLAVELEAFARASSLSIEIEQFTLGELRRQVVLAEDGGRVADVLVGVPHDDIEELVEADLLLDAASYATNDYLMDLPESASGAFNRDGQLLGLPLTLDGPALIVNADLVAELPRTYADFIASAQALDRGATEGFTFDFGNFYFAYAWFRGHGADLFQGDPPEPAINSDAAVRAATELQRLRFDLELIEQGTDYGRAHELFASGRLAYTFNGPWAVTRYFESGIPITIMPVPPVEAGTPFSGFMTVYGVLITAGTDSRTDAANVAKWLVRSEAQLRLANQAGRIPSSIRAVAALENDPILYGFGRALRHAEATPTHGSMADLWQPLGRFLQQLDAGPLTPGQIGELLDQVVLEVQAE